MNRFKIDNLLNAFSTDELVLLLAALHSYENYLDSLSPIGKFEDDRELITQIRDKLKEAEKLRPVLERKG